MRIWSLHPEQLDRQGLLACWRETLLAQAVLLDRTKGYTRHPQLERFRAQTDPVGAVGTYLLALAEEAGRRGYRFDLSRVERSDPSARLTVTTGQLDLEWRHLLAKLAVRDPALEAELRRREQTGQGRRVHPMVDVVPGPVAPWERAVEPRT